MRRVGALVLIMLMVGFAVHAQGSVGDLLAGRLVKPKVGQWAWYDLTDNTTGGRYAVRQAIVAKEKVNRKTGYWVELEVVPSVGYIAVYKMLLTGPASDPKNIHRVIAKIGPEPVQDIPPERDPQEAASEDKPQRKSLGMENVTTLSGAIRAEHYRVVQDGREIDLWVNERVPPTGIVRLRSPDGEMLLRNYGLGGEHAQSLIDEELPRRDGAKPARPTVEIEVRDKP